MKPSRKSTTELMELSLRFLLSRRWAHFRLHPFSVAEWCSENEIIKVYAPGSHFVVNEHFFRGAQKGFLKRSHVEIEYLALPLTCPKNNYEGIYEQLKCPKINILLRHVWKSFRVKWVLCFYLEHQTLAPADTLVSIRLTKQTIWTKWLFSTSFSISQYP